MALAYRANDKVVHPAHGAGVVRKVVRRTIAGESRQYYLIDPLAHDGMEIMVAVDKVKLVGLRKASRRSKMRRTLRTLRGLPEQLPKDFKVRQMLISERIQSADPPLVAEAARDLAAFKREKDGRLGVTDSKLLKRARECIAGELAVVEEIPFEDALSRIDEGLMLEDETKETRN